MVKLKSEFLIFFAEMILLGAFLFEIFIFSLLGLIVEPNAALNTALRIFFMLIPIYMSIFGFLLLGKGRGKSFYWPSELLFRQCVCLWILFGGAELVDEILHGPRPKE